VEHAIAMRLKHARISRLIIQNPPGLMQSYNS
jgi:hypothetical protein